jgi:hypothetical protein
VWLPAWRWNAAVQRVPPAQQRESTVQSKFVDMSREGHSWRFKKTPQIAR